MSVKMDITDLINFTNNMRKASTSFKAELVSAMHDIASDYLDIHFKLTEEHYKFGEFSQSWEITDILVIGDKISFEIKNTAPYASFLNDGWRQHKRFVPGYWGTNGTKEVFYYVPNYGSGMMLTDRMVEGSFYVEFAQLEMMDLLPDKLRDVFLDFVRRYKIT